MIRMNLIFLWYKNHFLIVLLNNETVDTYSKNDIVYTHNLRIYEYLYTNWNIVKKVNVGNELMDDLNIMLKV